MRKQRILKKLPESRKPKKTTAKITIKIAVIKKETAQHRRKEVQSTYQQIITAPTNYVLEKPSRKLQGSYRVGSW